MHVRGKGGGGRAVREPALFVAHLCQGHARPAQLLRDSHLEIAGGTQLLEILGEESVLSVVGRGPFPAAVDDLVGEAGGTLRGGHRETSVPKLYRPERERIALESMMVGRLMCARRAVVSRGSR